MKTKLSVLLFLISFSIVTFAQDARSILDKASDVYDKAGAISASFTLNTKDIKAKSTYTYDGKAYMKGNKFKIEVPDAITWFNGTTQWAYIKDTEEVSVSNPSGDELQGVSPSALFGIYKKGFNLAYKGEKKANGKSVYEVELMPQKKNSDITKIVVQIDKVGYGFSKIIVSNKSGIENTLIIKSYQTKSNIADNAFEFNKKDYPKAEIVDLR